jgi:RNA recognition motif-containing protein
MYLAIKTIRVVIWH